MITIYLNGGLGNQLFQYSLGRHLSTLSETKLVLDTKNIDLNPDRKYELDNYKLAENVSLKPIRSFPLLHKFFQKSTQVYQEKSHYYDPLVLQLRDNTALEGYWQTEKYFVDIRQELLNDLIFQGKLSLSQKSLLKEIQSVNSVSIHIRRGDYVTNPLSSGVLGTLPLEYYKNALSRLTDEQKQLRFFIFSDDIKWCKGNLNMPANSTQYIQPSTIAASDLELMRHCRHNIIANSSYSWWGAWLNENKEKIVITPKNWFKDKKYLNNDLIPDNWVKI